MHAARQGARGERRNRVRDRATEGAFTRTARKPRQRVAPQRHLTLAIDDAHPFIDQVQHFPPPPLLFEPIHVAAVALPAERQRHEGGEQDRPQLLVDELGQCDGDRGADDVGRDGCGRARQPRRIDRLAGGRGQNQAGADAGHEAIRRDRRRQRQQLPRPGQVPGQSADKHVNHTGRSDRGDRNGRSTHRREKPVVCGPRYEQLRQRADGGDGQSEARTVQEKRDEGHDERRPHRGAKRTDRPLGAAGGTHDGHQQQDGDFGAPRELRPVGSREKQTGSYCGGANGA